MSSWAPGRAARTWWPTSGTRVVGRTTAVGIATGCRELGSIDPRIEDRECDRKEPEANPHRKQTAEGQQYRNQNQGAYGKPTERVDPAERRTSGLGPIRVTDH